MNNADQYTIYDPEGKPVTVHVQPDRRLKKSVRWTRNDVGEIILRVPYRTSKQSIGHFLEEIAKQLKRQRKRNHGRTDEDLHVRAVYVNRRYFAGELEWVSIRWAANMQSRLGSCTNGGSTDGHIRISERIRSWPQWVIDYIIAHELAHRRYSNHGPQFWAYLRAAYPQTERALGFIQGVGFAQHETLGETD
jgi:predicted metal-dependent hydrolase